VPESAPTRIPIVEMTEGDRVTESSVPTIGLARWLRGGIEIVVLAMTALSPWAFAAVHPLSLLLLSVGLGVALVLWAALLLVDRRAIVGPCPVLACIVGLAALGYWQLCPLSDATLANLAPAAAELRSVLVPAEPEGLIGEDAVPRPPATLTVDPGATRRQTIKLLAVAGLFAVVRFGLATPAAFRRFAIVCTVNGALLSVFALAQRLSCPPNTLYWQFPSQGYVFGPFVCRNHFPFYVNVCFGLGLGLLLGTPPFRVRRPVGEMIAELGRHPATLWLIATLGLMLAASLYSLSRGGAVALAGAAIACGLLAVTAGRRSAGLAGAALAAGLALGLIAWLGPDALSQRLGTLGNGALEEGRSPLWERVLRLPKGHPIWGTGYGTFESVERTTRAPGDEPSLDWEHAHNDYLEVLIEGGLVQLVLVGLAIVLVYRTGIRAYYRSTDGSTGALVLGGLFGLTALAVHAFGDFGMHMPAIVVLATVLSAHLTAAGTAAGSRSPASRWITLPAAAAALVLAIALPLDAWPRERAERYRLAAEHATLRLSEGERDPVIHYLEAATACTPDDARLRLRLAEARYSEYVARIQMAGPTAELDESYLLPAVRDYLRTRALNPIYHRPHGRLAGARQHLHHADTAQNYLDRACMLAPADGGAWYLAGLSYFQDGHVERGSICWRNALQCSATDLPAIVLTAYEHLGVAGLVEQVLPPNPAILVAAAKLPPLADHDIDRRLVLARALEVMPERAARPEDLYLRAWLLRETGRIPDAIAAYQLAVDRDGRTEWRMELAELQFRQADYAAAAEQVRWVLLDSPNYPGARELNAALVRRRTGRAQD
jgi:O-antigen ligase/tetratricopeptide (TPR) repeat protein